MIERVRRFDAREVGLVAFASAGAAAFAWGREEPWAWLLLIVFALAAVFRITALPDRWRGAAEKVGWIGMGLLAAAILYWVISPEGLDQPVPPLPLAGAYAAPLLSALFLTGRSVWPPSRALVPAVLLTAALGASRAASVRAMEGAVGAVALSGALVILSDQRWGPASARRRRLLRFGPFAFLVGALGAGIGWALPRLQPEVVRAAAQAAFPKASSRFSPEARLGGAEELTLSPEVVMRVWSDRPRRLRAWVATRFDGANWLRTPEEPQGVLRDAGAPPGEVGLPDVPGQTFRVRPPAPQGPPDSSLERAKILLVGSVPGSIPAPQGVALVRLPSEHLEIDAAGLLSPALPPSSLYGVLSGPPGPEPAPGAELLDLPADLDPRLRGLARDLGAGAATDEERVERTLHYLQTELQYSLRVGRFRSRRFVAEFVFEKKRGWCQYFATAAAVLLRAQGIPARYVSGFLLRPPLLRGGHYVVRQADAHAWIEVWLAGRGWVEEDPTPSAGYDRAHGEPGRGWVQERWQWLCGLGSLLLALDWKAGVLRLWAGIAAAFAARGVVGGGLIAGAGGGLIVAVIYGLHRVRRSRHASARGKSASTGPGSEFSSLLDRLDALLAGHGVPRPATRAPLEHLNGITAGLAPTPLLELGRRIVERYYRARFGGERAGVDEVRALETALEYGLR